MSKFLSILILCVTLLTQISCGVLLDDAKYRGEWNLNKTMFYKHNQTFNATLSIEGLKYSSDTSADTIAPFNSQYFDVKTSAIKMYLESNYTFTVQDDNAALICSGRWEIDTYNNSVTWTIESAPNSRYWNKKNTKITNSWVMSTNNKFQFYVKASDFGIDAFEFELSEKPVPDKIEKTRFEHSITDKLDLNIPNHKTAYDLFVKYYKLNTEGTYYYLQNNITPDDKNKLYQYLNSDGLKFEYQTVSTKFDAMEAYFLRNGYTE